MYQHRGRHAGRTAIAAELPGGVGKNGSQNELLLFTRFSMTPASREQIRAPACVTKHQKSRSAQTAQRQRRVLRVTVWRHVMFSSMACLREPVSGGAEKKKRILNFRKGLYMFTILNFRWFMACNRPFFTHSHWR
jgi:hypothetical protein